MAKLVLIADDNSDNILLMKRILRRSGMEIDFIDAQTGREAIAAAIRRRPQLVLLDMKMPDMDGYETVSVLKSNEETKGIPVIAVTAQAMLSDRERALQAGCDEYVSKPIDSALLVDIVKRRLSEVARLGAVTETIGKCSEQK